MRIPFLTPKPKRLLTVDDDRIWQEFFLAFAKAHYDVSVTKCFSLSNAFKALEKTFFDAVLLDIEMPGGSGLDLYPALRHRWPKTQVTIVSGYVNDELKAKVALIGPARVVSKDDLMDRVFIDTFVTELGARPLPLK